MPVRRQKAATVLQEMERALGAWLIHRATDIPSSLRKTLVERWNGHKDSSETGTPTISMLVAECYLAEMLDLVVFVTDGTPQVNDAKRLRQLSNELGLVTIRNALAHPVRPFRPFDWYAVATIATDPSLLKLGLTSIAETVEAAESGRFLIKESDLNTVTSVRPDTNLPERFSHDLTGLIGRTEELKRLQGTFGANRTQAVVVHGVAGMGKTALMLQLLHEMVIDQHSFGGIEGVIYADFATIAKSLDDIKSDTEIIRKLEILLMSCSREAGITKDNTFSDLLRNNGASRIVFGVDNVDVALWHYPDQLFEWLQSLPARWQFILTTNIAPLTLPTVQIDALPPKAGVQLARACLSSKYGSHNEDHARALAYESDHIPSVIVDASARISTNPDPVAAARAARDFYLTESYAALLRQLKRIEVLAMEAAFLANEWIELSTAGPLMGVSLDDAMATYESLVRTPFIRSHSHPIGGRGERRYALTEAAHYLLLRRPLDLAVRSRMYEHLRKVKVRVGKVRHPATGDRFAYDSLSLDEDADIKDAFTAAINALSGAGCGSSDWEKNAAMTEALTRVGEALARHSNVGALLRAKAMLLDRRGAKEEAAKAIQVAVTLEPPDEPSYVLLSKHHQTMGRIHEAKRCLAEVINTSAEPYELLRSSPTLLREWLMRLEDVEDWEQIFALFGKLGCADEICATLVTRYLARATAKRYRGDGTWDPELKVLNDMVIPAIDRWFCQNRYPQEIVTDVATLLSGWPQFLRDPKVDTDGKWPVVQFLGRHLQYIASSMFQKMEIRPFETKKMRSLIRTCQSVTIEGRVNPFHQEKWRRMIEPKSAIDEALIGGYLKTFPQIQPQWRGGASQPYVISCDKYWEYYITIDVLRDINGKRMARPEFMRITRRMTILVRPDWERRRDNAIPVIEAIISERS